MKRVASVVLAVLLLCCAAPLTASAATDDWTYTVNNGNATITGYTGTETELVVPGEIDGYAVTAIADNALGDCADLAIVHLPLTISVATARIFGSHNPALRVCSETNDSYTSMLTPYLSYITDDWQWPPPQRKINSTNGVGANGLTICLCDGVNHGVDLLVNFKLWGKPTKWPKTLLNYFLLIICFGWIWMAF